MPARKGRIAKAARTEARTIKTDASVKRTFLTIMLSFAALLGIYFLLPSLPVEATGLFASPTTYMSPMLVLAFMFFVATMAYFFRKR